MMIVHDISNCFFHIFKYYINIDCVNVILTLTVIML